ncbi:RluA family pseudouridine synthase [Jannaschia seohaensis]|uniref:Pseudouridine synthase n=1 Tax=Jannaschia seohaensis TaxID=475081 RepID=A0A2Y9B397_9RHOB|nr:RluA family pseudouridine synthase [Jannaschia seohaensis]PWJ12519.1 tRNA pseudouridine32 synthase / 23S rRNA pseudouridine746 synthase [Jannaschia seohaensis]SSA51000.1 tRNA pseudouridine32 synthase / 23S rRNA pseudouridine746 synthase [Jannaschia seohaensis]
MSADYDPPTGPIPILYEDDHLIVVDKPHGLLSVPGRGEHLADCLLTRLEAMRPEVLLCHRLDRDTSGIMVFALTKEAQRKMGRLFETKRVRKRYIARVWGEVAEEKGTVDLPLIVDWPNRPLQHVNFERGKPSVTDWARVAVEDGTTRMRLMPRTGRSHQLRVHMRELGHPILGDPFYAEGPARDFARMMLHAEGLKFEHPVEGRMLRLEAPCPF